MRALILLTIACALAACSGQDASPPTDARGEIAEAEPGGPGLDRSHKGKPAPDAAFKDEAGEDITLADFQGRPVLVNLWASWCVPCVKELPTLDRLARRSGDNGLKVLAVSQDMAPQASVVAFLDKHRISDLGAYHDPGMRLSGALNAQILPTSILYDAAGNEVWRFVGDLDWTSAEAARLLAEAPAGGAR